MPQTPNPSSQTFGHVVLIASIQSHLPQMLGVAATILTTPGNTATLVYTSNEPPSQTFQERLSALGMATVTRAGMPYSFASHFPPATMPPTRASWLAGTIRQRVKKVPPLEFGYAQIRNLATLPKEIIRLMRAKKEMRNTLKILRPKLIVLPEENALAETSLITTSAKEQNIPTVITPFTIANATEFAESYKNTSYLQVRGFVNPIIARFFPHWIYKYKEKRLLLMSWPKIITTELLHLSPPDPWMINSGNADAIAVESHHMLQYYRNNGIPEQRLVLTGSLSDDTLTLQQANQHEERKKLCQEYQLDPAKPIVLCAFPPPWFPRPACEFSSFEELAKAWTQTMTSAQNYSLIIHPHPRLNAGHINILKQYGVVISQRDIAEVIPLCDLFVANVSATIRWAIACGIPVLNYDVYQWGFDDYNDAPGVLMVNSYPEFSAAFTRLTSDSDFRAAQKKKQEAVKNDWGQLDGQSSKRLLRLFHQLQSQHQRQ